MAGQISRREMLATAAAIGQVSGQDGRLLRTAVERNDAAVEQLLRLQITDPANVRRGVYPDRYGLHNPSAAGGILETLAASFLNAQSRFHRDRVLFDRMVLAADYLRRVQNEHGNIDLVTTNFNSPPDTGFVVHNVATAACLAMRAKERELLDAIAPFLRRAAAAMAVGGIHTPNHRWVVSSALAQVNELFPDPAYVRRIDEWLAEGIDIDSDGQYSERSTTVYNPVVDRSLVVMAAKLRRPELLDPVRRNLDSMLYLLHPGYQVVTEISRRQDQYQRGDMGRYWFSLQYLALLDGRGEYAKLAGYFAERASLSALMEYPELLKGGPTQAEIPENYEKAFPALEIARIRRGLTSATLILGGSSRFFTLRRGAAAINAVRFASAFFGKGQFIPQKAEKRGESYVFTQSLAADYVQPLKPPRRVGPEDWAAVRAARQRTEVCRLEQRATVTELKDGFRIRLEATGTQGVPLAVEISFADDGQLEGCEAVADAAESWVLPAREAVYRVGTDAIRFGPGAAPHRYTQVRGAQEKLPGKSVYITGLTQFDHTMEFRWA